jgi:hypothetical protein
MAKARTIDQALGANGGSLQMRSAHVSRPLRPLADRRTPDRQLCCGDFRAIQAEAMGRATNLA